MRLGVFRLPSVKESQHAPGGGAVHAGQNGSMEGFGRFKALAGTGWIALAVHAQKVGAVLAQEICRHAGGLFHLLWHPHCLRDLLLASVRDPLQRNDAAQGAALVDVQGEGHLGVAPSGWRDLAPGGQRVIVLVQRLQDHRSTSFPATSSTPFTSSARKNVGWILRGSE